MIVPLDDKVLPLDGKDFHYTYTFFFFGVGGGLNDSRSYKGLIYRNLPSIAQSNSCYLNPF
jgi:hypothetical protein